MNIAQVRAQYPQYQDLSDKQLADALHAKFYSDIPIQDYYSRIGLTSPKERTWGEAAKDIAAGVVSGAGSLVQLPGQLYGLATGDFSETGALGLGKDIAKYGEEMKSAGLKAREAERAQKIKSAEEKGQWEAFKTAFGETVKDPALLTSFLAEQAPQLLVPFGAAKVAQVGTAAKAAAAAQGLTGTAAEKAVEAVTKAAAERGTRAAIGAGAVQQGSDVGAQAYEDIYKELIRKGATEPDAAQGAINLARAAGASGAIVSLLAQRLPGARSLEESFAGVPGTSGRLLGAVKGALGEGISEVAEETGGKFGANLAMREVAPETSLTAGLGQTAGMAAIGGVGMGGVSGLARRPARPEVAPAPEVPRTGPLTPEEQADLDRQRAAAERPKTTEELLAGIQIGKPTTAEDIARIKDEHETAVIEDLLAQDAEMKRANEVAAKQREQQRQQTQLESEAEAIAGGISDVDRRVREGRIFSSVQDLIDRNIPFASTAINDINQKFGVINEAPLTEEERARIENIMGMVNTFTNFVNLPVLAPKPVDQFAENQAMEALIKERTERGPTEPLRAAPAAPSPRIEEAPVSQGVGEGAALRPESRVEPSAAQDRQLVTPAPAAPATPAAPDRAAVQNTLNTLNDGDTIVTDDGDRIPVARVVRNKAGDVTAVVTTRIGEEGYTGIDFDGLASLITPQPYIDSTTGERKFSAPATIEKPKAAAPAAVEAAAEPKVPAVEPVAPVKQEPIQTVDLKTGEKVSIETQQSPGAFSSLVRSQFGEPQALVAKNKDGEEIGRLTYMPNGGPIDVSVREQNRRQGVATALYDAFEAQGGKLPDIESGVAISDDARAVRAAREKRQQAEPAAPKPPTFESKIVSRQPAPDGMEVHVFTTTDGYGTGLFDADAGQYVNGSVTRFAGTDTLPKAEARAAEMLRKATPAESTVDVAQQVKDLREQQTKLLTKSGKVPAPRSPARQKYDVLERQIAELENRQLAVRTQKPRKPPKTIMGSPMLAGIFNQIGGLHTSLLPEFSTRFFTKKLDKKGRPIIMVRNPMIPGYGTLFNKNGKFDFGEIAEHLEAEGYLEPGSLERDYKDAGERAKELVKRALNGEEVLPIEDQIAKDNFEREASERQKALDRQEENRMIATGELQLEPEFDWSNQQFEENLGLDREFETDLEMYNLEPKDLEFLSDEELESELTDAEREQAQARRTRKAAEDAARQKAEGAAPREDEALLTRPTAEELKAKQEAAEKAAAEEKRAKAAEQERLRKEQQAKEEKARADETVKDFELGKSAEEQMTGMGDLFAEPPTPPKRKPRQGTTKQLEAADNHAKETGGTVVYQDGDIALVRGYSVFDGQPVYAVTNGDYRARFDIEVYTGNLVTPEQKSALIKIKQELEAEDKAKFDKQPSIKFTDGLATSANISPEIAGIVRGWKDLLGLKVNIYITTIDDAIADRNKFIGPHRAIGSSGLDSREAGVVRKLPNGDYYIAFKKSTSKTKMLEVIAHELGHIHEREVFNRADKETRQQILDEHSKWLKKQTGKTAREFVTALRAKTAGKTTRIGEGMMASELDADYWKAFKEWYADQVSRWAVTSEKPVSVVEKFFSRLAQALKSFYSKLKNAGYLPNETFVQYLNKTHAPSDRVISTDDGAAQQMLGEVKATVQKTLQKQPMPEKGLSHVSPELTNLAQPIFFPQNKTIIDRIEGMKDRFWQRLAQKTADQFRTIKEYSPLGYMQARLSKSVDGSLEGLLFHGQVFDDGGALNIKKNTKGMMDILKPIGTELDSYLMWVALNRESRLPEEKRSKIPNMDKLVARRAEFAAGELNGKPRVEVYQDVLRQMNQLNKSVLDIALAKGIINQEGYDKFSNDIYYIPFYKKMEEDGTTAGAQTASGLTSQYFSKELKGSEAPFGDLMENIVRNWSHILSASMKNAAAKTTIDDAMKLQAAEPNLKAGLEMRDGVVYSTKSDKPIEAKFDEDGKQLYAEGELRPDLTTSGTGMAKIMVDGQPMYFKITDELLMDSISSIGYMGPKSKFVLVMRDFKNMLQYGVTASPIFKVNNLIRDSVSALAVSDLKKSPVYNVMTGISLSKKDSPTYISALAGGGIFNFGSAYEGDQAKLIKRLLDQGVDGDTILDSKEKITKALKKTWDAYQHLGDRSEAANRLALYQQMRDKGMSHLQASFMARDLLDFSMQGSWPTFRFLTQIVPFMNARIQGLYKLGRDGINPTVRVLYNATTGKEIDANDKVRAAQFSTVTAAVMLASAMLYLSFKDDEDFKKRDAWDRDNFWWFKIPSLDIAFRIPKPFEVGAFGTLVERSLEQIVDQGAEGKQFGKSLWTMLWDTFSLNPTPQIFKPLVDIYANKDSFSGAPIESAGLERLSKQERRTDTTSPLAIALGGVSTLFPEKFQVSPVQMDYAIKGYFGWLGAMASMASTYAVMPFKEGEYPDARWLDRASLGLVRDLPAPQSAYVTAFYENAKEISQAYADMRHYREMGDAEKVQEILEKSGDKIALAKFYDKTSKNIANVRKQIQFITNDKTLDGATKKEEIERMKLIMSDLAKQAEEVRKSMKP